MTVSDKLKRLGYLLKNIGKANAKHVQKIATNVLKNHEEHWSYEKYLVVELHLKIPKQLYPLSHF